MDKRIGAGGILAIIIGILTLGGLLSVGLMKRAVGTILIMLVGVYAVSNVKGDFFGMIKDYNAKSEAADIRRFELERERLRLENETKLKILQIETQRTAEERKAKEQERIQQERERVKKEREAAREAARVAEIESKVQVNKTLVAEGFSFLEKNEFQEIHYKFQPSRYNGSNRIITLDTIISRNELTTSSKGLKWRSQRFNLEIMCSEYMVRVSNAVVYDGPLTTGNVVASTEPFSEWMEPKQWQRNWGAKWCNK